MSDDINIAARAECNELHFRHCALVIETIAVMGKDHAAMLDLPNPGHCFCGATTRNGYDHVVCCKCGDRRKVDE